MIISPEGSYIVISSESADCYFTAFKDKGPNSRHIMQGLLLFFFGGGKIIMVKGEICAKFTLFPVQMVENHGLKPAELKMVEAVIEENQEIIAAHWNKFFNKNK